MLVPAWPEDMQVVVNSNGVHLFTIVVVKDKTTERVTSDSTSMIYGFIYIKDINRVY